MDSGSSIDFNGMLANVQIYNASLPASDIQALYMEGIGGAPIDTDYLTGWWPLNGNTNDYSGYNNNGPYQCNIPKLVDIWIHAALVSPISDIYI